jgi:acetyl esterase
VPLDPQAKLLLKQLSVQGARLNQLSIEEIRKNKRMQIPLAGKPEQVAKVVEQKVPVQDGMIKVRIYIPHGKGNFPVFVYFHGGGFVYGDLDTVDTPLRAVTNRSGCIVVSVDYRLAPEYKFPIAPEDCYAATCWVAENIATFQGDPTRIAVGGDSAGGNLAAVVTLLARQLKKPPIIFQVLIYPCTDWSRETASQREYGKGFMLEKENILWAKKHYLTSDEDQYNPLASPLLAEDLRDLPPALIITAEYDPLRDEGEAYGKRLKDDGVAVQIARYSGMIHGFFCYAGVIDKGQKLIEHVSGALSHALNA